MEDIKNKLLWFRTKYKLEQFPEEWLIPIEQSPIDQYMPFNIITIEKKKPDPLYLTFTNLNISETSEIIGFYDHFGPLGILSNDIRSVYGDYTAEQTVGDFVIEADYDVRLFLEGDPQEHSLSGIAKRYQINLKPICSKFKEDGIEPTLLDIQAAAGEDLSFFKWEHAKFVSLLDLYINIKVGDINGVREHLSLFNSLKSNKPEYKPLTTHYIAPDGKTSIPNPHREPDYLTEDVGWWDKQLDARVFMLRAIKEFLHYIKSGIIEMPDVEPIIDPNTLELSVELQWKPKSLIRAMYIMFLDDVTSNIKIRHCSNCGCFYRGGRPEAKYCSPSCQNKAKTKRYQDKIRNVRELYKNGMKIEGIAQSIGKNLEQVRKWIEQGTD